MSWRYAHLLAVSALSVISITGHAASVTSASRMILSSALDSACVNNDTRSCDRVIDAPLLLTDADGVTTQVHEQLDYFGVNNTTSTPNFIFTAAANAKATLGTLKAFAEVAISGAGGGSPPSGITAIADVRVLDTIEVVSSSLPAGTQVILSAWLDVSGSGRGALSLDIRGRRNSNPLALVFGASDTASSFGDDLQDITGNFTAFVGETLRIDYALTARAVSTTSAWNGLPRSALASYGNSAFLYFSVVDPNVDVHIEGQSGFDYVAPASVPLPPAGLLLFSGIGLLARMRAKTARAAASQAGSVC